MTVPVIVRPEDVAACTGNVLDPIEIDQGVVPWLAVIVPVMVRPLDVAARTGVVPGDDRFETATVPLTVRPETEAAMTGTVPPRVAEKEPLTVRPLEDAA